VQVNFGHDFGGLKLFHGSQSDEPNYMLHHTFATFNSTPQQQHCHEQPHNGIRKASDNARGSQPSNSTAYEFQLNPDNCRSCNESSGSFLDDYLPRLRHSLRTTACWLQVTQAGTMGSKQRVDAG